MSVGSSRDGGVERRAVCYEALPDIDIAITIGSRMFLDRMASLAEAARSHHVERHYNAVDDKGFDILNFRQRAPAEDFETGGQLIASGTQALRIQVEMHASAWSDERPTRAAYVAFARQTFGPLLQRHNRTFGSRWRLRVARRGKPYQLPPASSELLHRFIVTANASSLHVLDWRRFYEFAKHSRAHAPEGFVARRLIEAGFSSKKAAELDALYQHLVAFKRLPSAW